METNNKLREALKEIRARLVYLYGRTDGTFDPPALKEVCEIADEALAEPMKNCEVGTPEEQEARFDDFCMAHKEIKEPGLKGCSNNCPFANKGFCDLHWAQMPYEGV